MGIFNQFSYPLMAIVMGLLLFAGLSRVSVLKSWHRMGILAVYAVVMIGIGLTFQYPDSPTEIETVDDVQQILTNGTSTFVMLYSNY